MPEKSKEQEPEKSQRNKLLLYGLGILVLSLAIGLPLGLLLKNSSDDAPSTSLSAESPNAAPITRPTSGGSSGSGGSNNSPPSLPPYSSPSFPAPVNNRPIQCLPDNFRIDALTSNICSNGLRREELYLRQLQSISGQNLILSPATPQGKAYAFLVNYDPFFQGTCSVTGLRERFVLMTLYFSTNGENWMEQVGWCGGTQHCGWSGITCNNSGSITAIDIESNNLVGTIPQELYALYQLQLINLFANSLSGTIPNWSWLSNLREIDLQQNLLTGNAVPRTLPDGLTSYKVSSNQLDGTIPPTIQDWTQLRTLWAGNNQISGTIPTNFGKLNKLTSLYLFQNRLQGTLPTQLGNILLEEIWLSNNFFEQQLPESLFFLGSLKIFRLENNVFSGSLPTWIGLLTNLQDLRIDHNNLAGTVPPQLNQLTDLEELHIGTNFWSGNLPNIFDNMKQLETFDMSGTSIAGDIPSNLFNIPTLQMVNLSSSSMSGNLPTTLGNASSLKTLHLYDMPNLRGSVPSPGQGQLTNLRELLLQNTGLSGSMPISICALRSNSMLDTLEASCLGSLPSLQCDYPDCCSRCY